MPDHSNIREVSGASEDRWRARCEAEQMQARLKVTELERDHYRDQLEAIFTRIGRGDHVDLYFANGTHIRLDSPVRKEPPQ